MTALLSTAHFSKTKHWMQKFLDLLSLAKYLEQNVGNKAKGRISKRVFQENKGAPNFPKNEHFLHVHMGKEMFVFRKIWRVLLWDYPFCFITDENREIQ